MTHEGPYWKEGNSDCSKLFSKSNRKPARTRDGAIEMKCFEMFPPVLSVNPWYCKFDKNATPLPFFNIYIDAGINQNERLTILEVKVGISATVPLQGPVTLWSFASKLSFASWGMISWFLAFHFAFSVVSTYNFNLAWSSVPHKM